MEPSRHTRHASHPNRTDDATPPNQPNLQGQNKKQDKKTTRLPLPTFRSFFLSTPLTPELPTSKQPRFKPLKRWYVDQVALNATPQKQRQNQNGKKMPSNPPSFVERGDSKPENKGNRQSRERADNITSTSPRRAHLVSFHLHPCRLLQMRQASPAKEARSTTSPHKPAAAYRPGRPRNSGSCSSRRTRAARSRPPSS